MNSEMDNWRVLILGHGDVGQTAFAVQFTLNCFVNAYDPTLEEGYRKQLLVDNQMCSVEVIDTFHIDQYVTLRDLCVREAQGYILLYSITSRSTFDGLENIWQSIQKVKEGDIVFMLVGNKSDKAHERQVSKEEGAALARRFGCQFFEASAKTAENVEQVFRDLVRSLRQTRYIEPGARIKAPPAKKKSLNCVIM